MSISVYCHGDKNYPCLVEVGLTEIDSLYCHRISEIKKKIVSKHKRYKQWMCSFKTNLNPFYKTYLDSLRLKNRNGPLWSPRSRLWSGCVSSDPRRELLEPKSSHIPLDEIQGFMSRTRLGFQVFKKELP